MTDEKSVSKRVKADRWRALKKAVPKAGFPAKGAGDDKKPLEVGGPAPLGQKEPSVDRPAGLKTAPRKPDSQPKPAIEKRPGSFFQKKPKSLGLFAQSNTQQTSTRAGKGLAPQETEDFRGADQMGENQLSSQGKTPASGPPSAPSQSGEGQGQELTALNEKLQKALNDHLYLIAEFDNFKKRAEEEKRALKRYDGERFIASLANEVLDDMERALLSAQNKDSSLEDLKKGLLMIQKKLEQVLKNFGVEALDPTGQSFDPSWQEALSYIKTKKTPAGCVAETLKKAYKLHDKVIRPAQVILSQKED